MKTHKIVNLKKIIDEKGLPRSLKSKKKLDMCVGVIPYITPKYQTADLKIKPSQRDGKKTSLLDTVMKGKLKKCKEYTKKQLCEKLVENGIAL